MYKLKSPAKLNLFLHITGKRPDGYHNLQTVFQLIDLCDILTFSKRDDKQLNILCDNPELVTADNLIIKAANALLGEREMPFGVDIHLEKHIPMGGGLGGGSSNAATTLLALNKAWDLNYNEQQLIDIAAKLGADVPVFVKGLNAFGEGVGEQLTPINLPEQCFLVLNPQTHVCTKTLFSQPELTRDTKPITIRDYLEGEPTHNDFTNIVCQLYPEVQAAFEALHPFGQPRLTGTGGCVYVTCDTMRQAQDLIGQIPKRMVAFATQGLRESPLHNAFWGVAKW